MDADFKELNEKWQVDADFKELNEKWREALDAAFADLNITAYSSLPKYQPPRRNVTKVRQRRCSSSYNGNA